jgi:uncharacterized membrane protein
VISRIRSLAERFRESLFFVPILMIAGAAILALVTVRIDDDGALATTALPIVSVTVSSARTILGTVAGATITVAGFVFAMTALTVQLGASSYSPRIIRGFQRDRFQQFVIGAAAGTFTFCLLALAAVQAPPGNGDAVSIPSLTVTLGVVFGVVTIVAIVAFIDHVVRRMRVDEVIRNTADETTAVIEGALGGGWEPDELETRTLPSGGSRNLDSTTTGWVRTIDRRQLVASLPAGTRLRLDVGVGDFATADLPIGRVWGSGDVTFGALRGIEIGRTRSLEQDPRFGIQLLVDIALRALSPGINDPTTAVTVVRHLERPLMTVLTGEPRSTIVRADRERMVVMPNDPDKGDYVVMTMRPIVLAARDEPPVLLAVADVLGRLRLGLLDRELDERVRHLDAEAEVIRDMAADLHEWDRDEIRKRLEGLGLAEEADEHSAGG